MSNIDFKFLVTHLLAIMVKVVGTGEHKVGRNEHSRSSSRSVLCSEDDGSMESMEGVVHLMLLDIV